MYRIVPGRNAKNLPDDLYEKVFDYMGGNVRAFNEEETPIPWDTDVDISNGKFTLIGGAGPSGFGYCKVEIPLSSASNVYFIEVYEIEPDDYDEIIRLGWGIKEV